MLKVKRYKQFYERACVEIKAELMTALRRRKSSIKDSINLALDHFLRDLPAAKDKHYE